MAPHDPDTSTGDHPAPGPVDHGLALSPSVPPPGYRRLDLPIVLLAGAVVLGVGLRAWEYAANPSLWLDELAITNNILAHSPADLLRQPLDYLQVAPIGFLLVVKALTSLLGTGEPVLHLYSLLTGIGALGLTAIVSQEAVGRRFAWIPTLLVAISATLIFQSVQVKPYSGNVLLCLAFVWIALRATRAEAPPGLLLPGILGVVAPWFSFPALYAMGAAGLALLLASRRRTGRAFQPRLLGVFALWGVSTAAAFALALARTPASTRAFMQQSWTVGFPPLPPRNLEEALWPLAVLGEMLRRLGGFHDSLPLVLLVVVGMVALVIQDRRVAMPLLLPFGAALVAATLRLYPLQGRVAIWSTPFIAIFLVAGARGLLEPLSVRLGGKLTPLALPMLAVFPALLLVRTPPPITNERVRPGLERLAAEYQPQDAVYVFYGAWQAWQYYAERLQLPEEHTILGGCTRADRGLPLKELRALAPYRRLWVVLAPVVAPNRDRLMFSRFLEGSGATLVEEVRLPDVAYTPNRFSSVMLYDLRQAQLLGPAADSLAAAIVAEQAVAGHGCWNLFIPRTFDRTPRNRFPDPEPAPARSR